MSESDASSVTNTSDSTIEIFEFEKVIKSLELAVEEANVSKDYLSYSTLLDIHIGDPHRYSYAEREELLDHLLSILSSNTELTYEIGWDLPGLLILYVDLNFQFTETIREAPCVYKIIKIFECLAIHGNAKELFLKSCELLDQVKISDNDTTDVVGLKEKFFDIKLYCIFELIGSCLKKIKTFYPSRFLSMTVTSFLHMVRTNSNDSPINIQFILKRAYSFARNYSGPAFPEDAEKKLSKDEIEKIKSDENYLQRKLLTGFITEAIGLVGARLSNGYSVDIVSYLQESNRSQLKRYFDFQVDSPLFDRFFQLALSFDVDLKKFFDDYIVEAHNIFRSFDYEGDQEDLNGEIFEKVITDYQTNVLTSIVDKEVKTIKNSVTGSLILFTHSIASKRLFDGTALTFNDALVFTLRLSVPSLIHQAFVSRSVDDACVFWSWFAIHQLSVNKKNLELEISKIPKILLTIYFQVLLFNCISTSNGVNFRYSSLTLLTRVLSLSPEEIAFSFLKDSLMNCPYDNVKAVLVGILKELLTKVKQASLEDDLEKLNLNDSGKSSAPPLPNREVSNTPSKFCTLTKEKANDIFELINTSIDSTFVEEKDHGNKLAIDQLKFAALSAYLNLLVVIKDDRIFSADNSQIESILSKMDSNISKFKKQHDETSDKGEENAVEVLNITLDRIKVK